MDNGYLRLDVQSLVEIWPHLNVPENFGRTFLSVYGALGVVPVMLSAWDPDLYLDPDRNDGGTAYDRWPFLPDADTWE